MTGRGVPYAPAIVFALCLTAAVGPGPDIDPAWLHYDAPAKTVRFQLIAGLTGVNGALNFNGFSGGGLTRHAFLVPEDSRPIADLPLHLQLQDLLALGYSLVSRVAYVTYIGLALRRADAEPVSSGATAYARFRRRAAFLMYHDGVAFV